jgi:predicted dehydrogenase
MFKIAIIGAGQLGSRHLQGLLKSALDLSIDVVDPFESSLLIARQRAEEIGGKNLANVKYMSGIKEIQTSLDLCIIATTADIRLGVLKELTQHSSVKNILLEKVLFQDLASYDTAQGLLEENKINAWVNCPRRIFAVSHEIKKCIPNGAKLTYVVTGGNWGLACNAIHHIDHLSFLNGIEDIEFDTSAIEKIIPGKRNGFSELVGTLTGKQSNGSLIVLNSRDINSADVNITIASDEFNWQIDEARGYIYQSAINSPEPAVATKFHYPYQSELTNLVCDDILSGKDPGLPGFEISMKHHKAMISAFSKIFSAAGTLGCPIT